MKCKICPEEAEKEGICQTCKGYLKKGVDEETLKRMYSDKGTMKIWKENEKVAEELANAYYDSVLDNYEQVQIKNDSKENFGYNTFVEGIRMGLDIIIPLLNKESQKIVKAKIESMLAARKNSEEN